MTREELTNLLSQDFSKVKDQFNKLERKVRIRDKDYTVEDIRKQYDPMQHDVMSPTVRPDKLVDTQGEEYQDALTGEIKRQTIAESVKVNRLPFPVQRKIVLLAAAFMVGERIMLDSNPATSPEQNLLDLLNKVWHDNKLDYKSKEIAKIRMSETHCAELWYDYEDPEYWDGTINQGSVRRLGMQILSESRGDKLYPVFDQYNDLIAFGRWYEVTAGDKKIEHFDIITDKVFYEAVKDGSNWSMTKRKNPYGSINIIYHEQPLPEWADVQPLIERKEMFASNFSDSNDYFALPGLVAQGDVENLPSKTEVGKLFQVELGGSVQYITKDQAPESMKMELDILDKEIHSGTHTPDISFETMRSLLGNVSGIALKLLFMDAQLKGSDNQEKFGEAIQRRLNLMKKIIISFNPGQLTQAAILNISPRFKPFMPVNDVEFNKLLMDAYSSGMISKRTMIERSTLVRDVDMELDQIKKEGASNVQQPIAPMQLQKIK